MALKLSKLKSLFIVNDDTEETKNKTENTEQKNDSNNKDVKTNELQQDDKRQAGGKLTWKSSAGGNEPSNQNDTTVQNTNQGVSQNLTGEFSQKIFDQLTKAIVDANLPGEDYIEFMEALQAMKNIPLEENIKIQTVFATLASKGLTKQKVLESADYYLKILENERSKFYESVNLHGKTQITQKQNDIMQIEKSLQEKERQILQLQDEIKQSQEIVAKLKNDILQADSKVKKVENDFQLTYETVANTIKRNIEKVKSIQ